MRYNKNGEYLYVAVAQLSGVQILPAISRIILIE